MLWLVAIIFGLIAKDGSSSNGGSSLEVDRVPTVGATTNKRDGETFETWDKKWLMACAGKWWAVVPGDLCCAAGSGRAITLTDGNQVVCALDDESASYRWQKVAIKAQIG